MISFLLLISHMASKSLTSCSYTMITSCLLRLSSRKLLLVASYSQVLRISRYWVRLKGLNTFLSTFAGLEVFWVMLYFLLFCPVLKYHLDTLGLSLSMLSFPGFVFFNSHAASRLKMSLNARSLLLIVR